MTSVFSRLVFLASENIQIVGAKIVVIFNITYNVNKTYCMVIDNNAQNMKYTHPVTLKSNVLPYTTKCKYLGHIINNKLTDDDDIARQKISFHAHANVLARKFRFCSSGIKMSYFTHTVVQCTHQVYGVNLKTKFEKCNRCIQQYFLESYIVCHHVVVLVLCSFLATSNHLMNLFAHLYSLCYVVVYNILRIHFFNYVYTDIHFRSHMFKYWTATQLYVWSIATSFLSFLLKSNTSIFSFVCLCDFTYTYD